MKQNSRLSLIALAFALAVTPAVFGAGPAFTSIDFPGATSTQAWGITMNGDIAGFYTTADKATHGFLLSRGQYSSVDFPGAAYTSVNGISPKGDLAGDYAATVNGSGPHHGFVLSRDGAFTSIDYPGSTSSWVWGMNSHGDILGSYTLTDNVNHNFLMSGSAFGVLGAFSNIDDSLPGGGATVLNGFHGGDIVGGYTSADKVPHGFVMSDGQTITIDYPGASFTNATNIDSRGEIVGRYTLNGVTHAYLYSGGQFNTFDYPGATFTGATVISSKGDIVGRYRDSNNVFHGFLLTGFRLACSAGN